MDVIVYTMHFLTAKKVTLALLFPLATPAAAAPAPSQAKPKEGKTNPKLSSSPHTTAPKPVPAGRRKRSSLSASSSSPTSPKSASASGPRPTPPCSPLAFPLAGCPVAGKAEQTAPKVVKAGKQGKQQKAKNFKPAEPEQAAPSASKPAQDPAAIVALPSLAIQVPEVAKSAGDGNASPVLSQSCCGSCFF